MTFQTDQIQAIIAEIDEVLGQSSGFRLPWSTPVETTQQRQVLDRVRTYLQTLQEQLIWAVAATAEAQPESLADSSFFEEMASPDLAVDQEEVEAVSTTSIQPLQAEVEALQQRRDALMQEIQQLEQQRQQYTTAKPSANQQQIVDEFLQVLASRLQESLTQQLPQTLSQLAAEAELVSDFTGQPSARTESSPTESATSADEETLSLNPQEQAEQLRLEQARLARLLGTLDSKLGLMFETLQKNLDKYQTSLSRGLEKMHGISAQSEERLNELVNRLGQEPEAAAPLDEQNLLQQVSEDSKNLTDEELSSTPALAPEQATEEKYNIVLPYAGIELPTQGVETEALDESVDEEQRDAEVSNLLASFNLIELDVSTQETDDSNPFASQFAEALLEDLNESDAEIDLTPQPELPSLLEELVVAENATMLPLNDENVSEGTTTEPEQQESADTIASLSELIENVAFSEAPAVTETLLASSTQQVPTIDQPSNIEVASEIPESFVPAASEEELLPVHEAQVNSQMELWLNVKTLQQLSEDLSSLEKAQSKTVKEKADVLEVKSPQETAAEPGLQQALTQDEEQPSGLEDGIPAARSPIAEEFSTHLPGAGAVISEPENEDFVTEVSEEESDFVITDDVLAEFDDLFGEPLPEIALATSEFEVDLTESPVFNENQESEKKNLGATGQTVESGKKELRFSPPTPQPLRGETRRCWYLGIDFGTTGVSAVLLNATTRQMYPISWLAVGQRDDTEPSFRLSAVAYLSLATGDLSLVSREERLTSEQRQSLKDSTGVLLQNFKPYLKVGLPYHVPQTDNWEPVLQWSDEQPIPLYWFRQALEALLATLNPNVRASDGVGEQGSVSLPFSISAVGLETEAVDAALSQLAGVIASCPADWPEAYRFNVRESMLRAGLVTHPEQICFVEEAIASLLAELQDSNVRLQGKTLIVHAGATTIELGVVDLPGNIQDLTHNDFYLRSFHHAGDAIDQDIICQLFWPPGDRTPRPKEERVFDSELPSWNWQADALASLASMSWDDLGLDTLTLPLPGEPDVATRHRLQQRLQSSPFGQALLEAAKHVKLILQHQDCFTLDLGEYRWVLWRRELESRVFLPFIQRLNRELNALLVRHGITVEAIHQAICTGGTAELDAIAQWLRQKLPNATVIQDSSAEVSEEQGDSLLFTPSLPDSTLTRIARGLAALPLYPQVLDTSRHQYSDYFLLLELLRTFGEQPLSVGRMMQRLERKGINTGTCQRRLLSFLDGYLPPGIVPAESDAWLLTQESLQNPVTQLFNHALLFYKEGNQTYRLNSELSNHLRQYFSTVLEQTQQPLDEPYAAGWLVPIAS